MLFKLFKNCSILLIALFFISCGTGKKYTPKDNSPNERAKAVIKKASNFIGTPYKYGGNTKRGMDCSALVQQSFQAVKIELPRVSREQAKVGVEVKLRHIKVGDVLFFKTSGNKISHAGIVDHIKNGEIFFIHASSSRGVMISSFNNAYWKKRFVKAVRYLF